MRERLTSLVAFLLLALVTGTSYWYARTLKAPQGAVAVTPGTPDFKAERLVITQFDDQGRASNKLFAERLLHFADTDDIDLVAPRLVSLRPDQPQFEVKAERGQIDNAGERVHLHGTVELRRAAAADTPGMQVHTEYLLAIPDLDRFSTDRPVAVEHGAARIVAEGGMQLDNIARTAQFEGNVRIELPPANSKEP